MWKTTENVEKKKTFFPSFSLRREVKNVENG